jgi:periplasmic protein TonB
VVGVDGIDSTMGIIIIEEEKKPDEHQNKKTKLEIPDPNKKKVVDDKADVSDSAAIEPYNPLANIGGLIKGMPAVPKKIEFKDAEPIWVPSQMPEFPGGEDAMAKYFQKNYRVPADVTEDGAASSVSVRVKCVIEKDGSISNIEIVKDGGYPVAAAEFVKVVEKMPRWSPGYQGAHAVRVFVTIPLKIRLR